MSKFQKIICSKNKKDLIWILNFILNRDNFRTNIFKKEQNADSKNVYRNSSLNATWGVSNPPGLVRVRSQYLISNTPSFFI